MMKQKNILVVDDEEDICEILLFNLESEGFCVTVANSAEDAIKLDLKKFDLILLDVMMGKMSGFKFADTIKKDESTKDIPIIFLTAKTTENDTLTGFSIGADDYITKPFSIKQVIARVKAVLKRYIKEDQEENIITFDNLIINISQKSVFINAETVELTKKEYEILVLLVSHTGQVFSREEILQKVWKNEAYVLDRTVDVNITRLRKKIKPYSKNLITRLGFGYCWK